MTEYDSLTYIENQYYDCICEYYKTHNNAPTIRDIQNLLGTKSTSTVHKYITKLAQKGFISYTKGHNRSTIPLKIEHQLPPYVPVYDVFSPYDDFFENENIIEHINYPATIEVSRADKVFAIKHTGNAMIKSYICDGDYVYAERTDNPRSGHIVIAQLKDKTIVVRQLYYEEGHRILVTDSMSPSYPIIADELKILGEVIAVTRMY